VNPGNWARVIHTRHHSPGMGAKGLLPLVGLVASVFIFNMSEFMPVGLLTEIAEDMSVTESQSGLIVSFYAWAVALLSLPLMLLFKNVQHRRLMLLMVGIFTLFQALSAIAPSYWFLVGARIGVAVAHSVFWAIVTPMAVECVEPGRGRTALAAVAAGSSMSLILGLPLGRIIGLALGWRMTFATIAAMGLITLIVLAAVLPRIENPGTLTLRRVPEMLKSRLLLGTYALVALYVTGNYMGFSYIEPFLSQVSGMSEGMITLTMTVYGLAGFIGGFLFARYYEKGWKAFMLLALLLVSGALLLMLPLSEIWVAVIVLFVMWGIGATLFCTIFQNEIIRNTVNDGVTVAVALFSGIFNAGIAMGSMFGGMVIDDIGIGYIGLIGGSIILLGLVEMVLVVIPCVSRARKLSGQ